MFQALTWFVAAVVLCAAAHYVSAQPMGWPEEVLLSSPPGALPLEELVGVWDGVEMYTGSWGDGSFFVGDGYVYMDNGIDGSGTWIFGGFTDAYPPELIPFGDADPAWGSPSFRIPEPASLILLVPGLILVCSRRSAC